MFTIKLSAVLCILSANASSRGGFKTGVLRRGSSALDRCPGSSDVPTALTQLRRAESTQLMAAVDSGMIEAVDLVVGQGVNVNLCDPITGTTALIKAIEDGDPTIVEYLIRSGANVNQARFDGCTPLMATTRLVVPYMALAKVLIFNLLRHAGADTDREDIQGRTALMQFVEKCDLEMVIKLIDGGADVYHEGLDGKSALDIARENLGRCSHTRTVQAMIEAIQEVMDKTEYGYALK